METLENGELDAPLLHPILNNQPDVRSWSIVLFSRTPIIDNAGVALEHHAQAKAAQKAENQEPTNKSLHKQPILIQFNNKNLRNKLQLNNDIQSSSNKMKKGKRHSNGRGVEYSGAVSSALNSDTIAKSLQNSAS